MPVWLVNRNYVDNQDGSLLTQSWFNLIEDVSVLNGSSRNFCYWNRIRALEKTGEACRVLESVSYTPGQIKKALEELELTVLEKQILDTLEKLG